MGQATVPGSNTVRVFTLPAGLCNVSIYNLGTQSVFLGTSANVTTSNGLQCHSVPTSFNSYVSSSGTDVFGTTGNATAGTINYVIVTDQK